MRESRTYGSVRGARGNSRPYREPSILLRREWAPMCRFSDAGMTRLSSAPTAGVRKAPRHEIAGGWAPAVLRALWGFSCGVGVEEVLPKRLSRWRYQEAWLCVSL